MKQFEYFNDVASKETRLMVTNEGKKGRKELVRCWTAAGMSNRPMSVVCICRGGFGNHSCACSARPVP